MNLTQVAITLVTIYAILANVWWIDYVAYFHIGVLLMVVGAYVYKENLSKNEK